MQLGIEAGQGEAGPLQRVGRQDARAAGVGHDRDTVALERWQVGEAAGAVEQVLQRGHPEHARPGERPPDRPAPSPPASRCGS